MGSFKIQESQSYKYSPRTYFNAKSSDLTIAFAVDLTTAGELLTHRAAGDKYLSFGLTDDSDTLEIAKSIIDRMKKDNVKTLNIAGNGIYTLSKHGCNQSFINFFIFKILNEVRSEVNIEHIFTGGQTGVDLAGAVFAKYCKINATITLPKGFIQRFEDKKDIIQSREDIEDQINFWCDDLSKRLNCKSKEQHKLCL